MARPNESCAEVLADIVNRYPSQALRLCLEGGQCAYPIEQGDDLSIYNHDVLCLYRRAVEAVERERVKT